MSGIFLSIATAMAYHHTAQGVYIINDGKSVVVSHHALACIKPVAMMIYKSLLDLMRCNSCGIDEIHDYAVIISKTKGPKWGFCF